VIPESAHLVIQVTVGSEQVDLDRRDDRRLDAGLAQVPRE
jgi:hypothetical protein